MNMRRVMAVFKKQCKDTFKNKTVLIQFVLFPAFAVVMKNAVKIDNLPNTFFVILFATMYIGMAPMTSMASIISEEKEKNTLRVLMMANVKPVEYLLGIGSYIFTICLLGSVVFGLAGGYEGKEFLRFELAMVAGVLASMMIGAAIGMLSKNQMSSNSMTMPTMMVFAFLPMISMFNSSIKNISNILYTQQISYLINDLTISNFSLSKFFVIGFNILLFILIFLFAYKKKGLSFE